MPRGFIQYPPDGSGKQHATYDRGAEGHAAMVVPVPDHLVIFEGRGQSFRTPGRAGTVGQELAAIHNATGSAVLVKLNRVTVDLAMTVVKAITVLPPIIRLHRFTAVPTGGTAMPKVAADTTLSSNAAVTCWQDASADGTSSGTALAVTIPSGNIVSQEFAPRFITAAGYEMADRITFFEGNPDIILQPLQGVAVELVYTATGQNPITDMWIVGFDWHESQF